MEDFGRYAATTPETECTIRHKIDEHQLMPTMPKEKVFCVTRKGPHSVYIPQATAILFVLWLLLNVSRGRGINAKFGGLST